MRAARAPAAALALAASAAVGGEPPPDPDSGWTVVSTRPIVVKMRAHPGTRVKEILAIGLVSAPPELVQETLLDGESFPRFMPYVKESRKLPVATADGSWFTYQRVAPPLVAARDSVYHVWLEESLGPGGSGAFRNRWEAVSGMVPSVPGVVRTPISSGSWEVRAAKGTPGSRAAYRFLVDPGGNVPSWLVDMGNRSGIAEVFKALETEANRRAALPRRAAARVAIIATPPVPPAAPAPPGAPVPDPAPPAAPTAAAEVPDAGAPAGAATAPGTGPGAGAPSGREPQRVREPPRDRPAKKRERKRARSTPASP
jgi:hypothetical protein